MIANPAFVHRATSSTPRLSQRAKRVRAVLASACVFAAFSGAATLIGCNSQSQSSPSAQQAVRTAPRDAERVAQGTGELSYKAPVDGTLYAEDVQTGATLFRERLRAGQHLVYQADTGTVTLDNRPVRIANLYEHRGHEARLYFDKSQ